MYLKFYILCLRLLFYEMKVSLAKKGLYFDKKVKDFDSSLPVRIFCLPAKGPSNRCMFAYVTADPSIIICLSTVMKH